jgi:hypothetical protein
LTVLAVDLPGRRAKPGDLWTLTIADWVVAMIARQIPVETVSRTGVPEEVPRTWILTLRDHTHPVGEQRASIEAVGGVQEVIEMDTCHGVMVSEPERLAKLLVERCRQWG